MGQRIPHRSGCLALSKCAQRFEPENKPGTPSATKARAQTLQVFQGLPKQILSQRRIALAIGIGKAIALGCGGSANRREGTRVQGQSVTDIVEAQAMSQLCEDQCEHMTP